MSFTTIEQAHRQAAEREEKRNPLASKMSLRDHFAAKAMQGLMGRVWGELPPEELFKTWATSAYALADAMLKAREA
jgi:hypothetical protein